MMTTTITVHAGTKSKMLEYGNMGESYDDVINRMFCELETLQNDQC